MSDEEAVTRVRAGEAGLFELLMKRYNQRVYRIGRAVLRDDSEAEDLTQETWVRAFTHLKQFGERARFSTWLTRIALHEAWARARRRRRFEPSERGTGGRRPAGGETVGRDPEQEASLRELQSALEHAVDALPALYRTVFVLREIEELSTAATAECLGVTRETVKVRLHRARRLLRRDLLQRSGSSVARMFPFLGKRCDRMVGVVGARMAKETA